MRKGQLSLDMATVFVGEDIIMWPNTVRQKRSVSIVVDRIRGLFAKR